MSDEYIEGLKVKAEDAYQSLTLMDRHVLASTITELQAANAALEAQCHEIDALHIEQQDLAVSLNRQLTAEREKVAALQARVDALMIEYRPAEMTQAQRENWATHQVASGPLDTTELRSALSSESAVHVSAAPTLVEQLTVEREARAGLEAAIEPIIQWMDAYDKWLDEPVMRGGCELDYVRDGQPINADEVLAAYRAALAPKP